MTLDECLYLFISKIKRVRKCIETIIMILCKQSLYYVRRSRPHMLMLIISSILASVCLATFVSSVSCFQHPFSHEKLSRIQRYLCKTKISSQNGRHIDGSTVVIDDSSINISINSLLDKAGGAYYRQSVCTKEEMYTIHKELAIILKTNKLAEERSSIAQNRLAITLQSTNTAKTSSSSSAATTSIEKILTKGSIFQLIERTILDKDNTSHASVHLSNNIPVELRVYEKTGASMAWHRDDVLYDPPQIEVVFTIENTSDCVTMWKIENENLVSDYHSAVSSSSSVSNPNDLRPTLLSQETHPNSILLLKAGGPEHCVTSLKHGRRVILKCAYVYENSKYLLRNNSLKQGDKNVGKKHHSKQKKKRKH